ncbi:MAG: T9SS type A sorting domain-containing protein, partial [Bacteroidia bacterium]
DTNTIYISVCDFEYIGFGLHLNGKKRNTHYGLGVYKTTDGGATWNPTGLSFSMTQYDASLIRKILIDPTNSNHLIACGVSGMYTSSNAGVSWNKTSDSLFWDLVQDPLSPSTVYAATGWVYTANTGSAAIYKSTNFGTTWTLLNSGIPLRDSVQRVKLAVAPSDPNYIYAITVDTLGGLYAIYKSTNAGTTWTHSYPGVNILEGGEGSATGGQGNYDLGFMVNPLNRDVIYVGGVNTWGSSDGGQTFDPVAYWMTSYGPTIHGDVHFLISQPVTNNFFACSDGGIYRTTNILSETWADAQGGTPWPTQWTKINSGMNISSFYRVSSSKNASGLLLAGAQDNGSFYFDGSGWNTIYGGDGMDNYLDTVNNGFMWAGSQYGSFGFSSDGGMTFGGGNPNVNFENAEWTSPIIADYKNYGTLYAGFTNVTKSTDNGNTWSSISNFNNGGFYENEICALAVSNANQNTIFAAKRVRYEYGVPGMVYVTPDAGNNWFDITPGLPDSLYFTSIEAGESSNQIAYVTMAGFSAGNKVFKTTDQGSNWQNISYNLPNIPVNCVKYIPNTGGDIMIATDLGIYVLKNGSSTWVNQSAGLPNVIITDIEFNRVLNKIYISTFGRGIWATDLNLFTTGVKSNTTTISPGSYNLFPSVNSGKFTIAPNENKTADIELEILNVNGQIVHSEKLKGKSAYSFDLTLPAGLYFAKLKTNSSFDVKRFVVQ